MQKLGRFFSFGAFISVVLAGTGACGGKVVLDGGGQGGAGSSADSSAASSMPTAAISSGTGIGPGNLEQNCGIVCDALEPIGCSEEGCQKDCVASHDAAGQCADEFAALVACFAEHVGDLESCNPPPECTSFYDAFATCQISPCSSTECSGGGDQGCSCEAVCSGTKFAAQCDAGPSGSFDCLCVINDEPVAKCQDFNAPCSIDQGCCAPIFFGQE